MFISILGCCGASCESRRMTISVSGDVFLCLVFFGAVHTHDVPAWPFPLSAVLLQKGMRLLRLPKSRRMVLLC